MLEAAGERARPLDFLWVAGPVALTIVLAQTLSGTAGLVAWLTMFVAMVVGTLVWLRRRVPRDPWWPGVGVFLRELGVGLVALGAVGFYGLIVSWLAPESNTSETSEVIGEATRAGGSDFARLLLVMAVSLGPIAEELFFRGFLMHALGRWLNRWLALGLQATAFALIHDYDLQGSLTIMFVGLVLGALVMWRRGLIAAVVLHLGFNGYSALVAARAYGPRPVIGVHCAREPGCKVVALPEDGPAYLQGIRIGDRITRFEGHPIESHTQLIDLVTTWGKPGQLVQLEVERDGEARQVLVRLGTIED